MRTIACVQLSPEWFEARKGVPTASQFGRILTPKTGKPAAGADDYLCELVAERCCLVPAAEKPLNGAMRHGVEYEAEARRWFEFDTGGEAHQVGLCLSDDGRFGCSPDGLLKNPGGDWLMGLELKCPQGKTHVRYLLDGTLPDEYRCQVHGSMIVTGLPCWWFVSYCPGLAPLKVLVRQDDFTVKLRAALDEFHGRYTALLSQLQLQAEVVAA